MKKASVLLVLLMLCCAPKESFQQTFPIPIKDYFYSKSGNQLVFTIKFENDIPSSLYFESLYFQGNKATNPELKANYVQFKMDVNSLLLNNDAPKEYGNQPPIKQNLPFKIMPSEAVLGYKLNNQIKYYKFNKVKEKANI